MDTKHKELLARHRPFLCRNVIWSNDLAQRLKQQGLITDFMIKDIEACQSREDKVKKMLEVIQLKSIKSFNKFLDVLQVSGHVFIADFLREDEEDPKLCDLKDMCKQLPFLQKVLSENERNQIENYMTDKVESQMMKVMWRSHNKDKDKALEARQQQIEEAYKHEEQFKLRASAIENLEKEIGDALEDKMELKTKLAALSTAHREMQQKHREAMDIQMKYNLANDNAVKRANDRIAAMENVLRAIKAKLDNVVNLHKEKNEPYPGSASEDHIKEMKKIQGDYFFVVEDVDLFIRKFKSLLEVKKQYEKLMEERDYILIHFGWDRSTKSKKAGGVTFQGDNEPSLIDAYKSFAVKNEENIEKMRKEIEKYDGLLEENKHKLEDLSKEKSEKSRRLALGASTWQSAIMGVMRTQLQDLKAEARKKESLSAMQEEEMGKLKNRIAELERQLASGNLDATSKHTLNPRDVIDGVISAMSAESVEVINAETPKPNKIRNLPPLKTSPYANSKVAQGTSTSPRQSITKTRIVMPPTVTVARPIGQPESQAVHVTNFSIGPISSQMNPQSRMAVGRGGPQMGSVLGDLKMMNKHHTKTNMFEEGRSGARRSNNAFIK